jgi:hypothetical protein
MAEKRAPQRTRQLTPSRPNDNRLADDRAGRGSRSFSDARDRNGRRRATFGERMREFTGRMPLVGRATGYGRRQRRIDREWENASMAGNWDNAEPFNDGPPLDRYGGPPGGMGDDVAGVGGYGRPAPSQKRDRGKAGRRRLRDRNFSVKVIAVLALMSVIVGFCCTQSTLQVVNVAYAAYDAKAQVNALQALAKGGNVTDTSHLTEMQTRLVRLNEDLYRLQSAIPSQVASTSTGASLNHTLTMALDLVQAGRYGVDAALILVPHLKGVLSSVGSGATATPAATAIGTATAKPSPTATATVGPTPTATPIPGNVTSGGLTMDDVTRVQQDITYAGVLAQRALTERQYVNDSQLRSIGLGSVVSILQKLDSVAPKLPTYLGYANSVMSALPELLGITKPAHYLFFDMDSDEMRPTGGFLGNYALITVQNGKLISGIHLLDTLRLDCPKGLKFCPPAPIPQQYAWMNAFPDSFLMRDANISPDFPASAKLIMQKYQQESGQAVDGVFMITPEIIRDILKLTGPLKAEGYDKEVNAQDLQDVIHYYHIVDRGATTPVNGNTARKAFDSQLGSLLLHKVATLSASQQGALMKEMLEGFGTKDVQIYLNDTRVESLLSTLHMDSTIPMPSGMDGIMLSDTNVGATYYSRDMEETVKDNITFDSKGNAIHDMTVTYTLPFINHVYTPVYGDSNGNKYTWYSGVSRMIVPDGSKPINGNYLPDGTLTAMQIVTCNISTYQPTIPSCGLLPAPEAGHVVWAVRINNLQVKDPTLVFHMKWTTPNVLKTVDGKTEYNLHIYKQAGTHIAYNITIMPPSKQQIAQPLANPLRTPAKATPGTSVQFTSPSLVKDTLLTVTFVGS